MINLGRDQFGQAVVGSMVVVVIDEGTDLQFEDTGKVAVFQKNSVLGGMMPAFDFVLGLGVE